MEDRETSNETVSADEPARDASETPPEECVDPFAIEESDKKFSEISIDEKPDAVKPEQLSANTENAEKECDEMEQDPKSEEEQADDDDDDEEEEEEDEDENAALRAEMEADWQKQATEEKEKNQGMTALLDLIRSKHRRTGSPSKQRSELASDAVPELKLTPFGMDGKLKLTIDGDKVTALAMEKRKRKMKKKQQKAKEQESVLHVAEGTRNKKKVLKQKLKQKLLRKREESIKRHRREFGAEEDHLPVSAGVHITEQPQESEDEDYEPEAQDAEDDEAEKVEAVAQEAENKEPKAESRAGTVPLGDEDDSDSGSDPEDGARAALMANPVTLSKEARALLDEEAEEEDEDGGAAVVPRDEHEEEFGIAKDLLADKAENRRLRKLKKQYDDKRMDVHRKLCQQDDDKQLQLMKRAFMDGEYGKLKHGGQAAFLKGDDVQGQVKEFQFSARHAASSLQQEPRDFLSDDEEKNEFCVYGAGGKLNDVHTIRMRLMEWQRLKEKDVALHNDKENREERELRKQRKRRVQRKEFLARSRTELGEDTLATDGHAAKLLEKARNKKLKPSKKPLLGKAATTAFMGGFGGSSFASKHRNKCVEKAKMAEIRSKTGGTGGSKKAVVFERVKKRKREDSQGDDHGIFKKRRMQ